MSVPLRNCTTAQEVRDNHRAVKARLWGNNRPPRFKTIHPIDRIKPLTHEDGKQLTEAILGNIHRSFELRGLDYIQSAICWHTGLGKRELAHKRRIRKFTWPRFMCFWLYRQTSHLSYRQIGMKFGKTDHTTIIHGIRAIEARMAQNSDFHREMTALLNSVRWR